MATVHGRLYVMRRLELQGTRVEVQVESERSGFQAVELGDTVFDGGAGHH